MCTSIIVVSDRCISLLFAYHFMLVLDCTYFSRQCVVSEAQAFSPSPLMSEIGTSDISYLRASRIGIYDFDYTG
ncbi:MAG: hypothetical protein EZS28_030238, partial [Streblomastix strix]